MARLNPDGTLDPTFELPTMGSGFVEQIAVQPDDGILIGGNFHLNGSVNQQYLARLRPDGRLDEAFPRNLAGNFAIQPDGKIVLGGNFVSQFYGLSLGPVERLNADGSVDGSFHKPGITGTVSALAPQPDGGILAAGTLAVGTNSPRALVRVAADGGLDPSFNPALPWPASLTFPLFCAAVQNDGLILLGYSPGTDSRAPFDVITRLLPDGITDRAFKPDWFDEVGPNGVTVLALPVVRFSEPRMSDGGVSVRLQGTSGGRYAVHTSTNLVDWQVWTHVQLAGASMALTNAVSAIDAVPRFYRAVAE